MVMVMMIVMKIVMMMVMMMVTMIDMARAVVMNILSNSDVLCD